MLRGRRSPSPWLRCCDAAIARVGERRDVGEIVTSELVGRAMACAAQASKDHVNLFLYDGAIVPDPEHIITGGHDNKTARTISFRQGETVKGAALTTMLKQIVANNRAGGWRKLKNQ
jgi:hypothetical protein